ncbi:unnamed protein product [Pedinophyceae sp. YPF-701]|nr:unnamed protein product [Pedinophyceae sp. YPF-701]
MPVRSASKSPARGGRRARSPAPTRPRASRATPTQRRAGARSAVWGYRVPEMAVLALATFLHVAGIVIFARGFLLTRVEVPNASGCLDATNAGLYRGWEHLLRDPGREPSSEAAKDPVDGDAFDVSDPRERHADGPASSGPATEFNDGCWAPRPFRRAVLVVVDALRYDMVVAPTGAPPRSHQGTMPFTRSLLSRPNGAARAWRFVADPPTTTSQRVKGLATGGLPTFIDIGTSLTAGSVAEDSVVSQFRSQGLRLGYVGDDVWGALYPGDGVWEHALPYPSFDIHDLHTVDRGVREHIPALLHNASSWDVVIGHYLGVDHAGHVGSVDTPTMAAKLAEIDQHIEDYVRILDADAAGGGPHSETLLLVLGDHGMTDTGDHGGGTPEETDSFLLAYSPRLNGALTRCTGCSNADSDTDAADVGPELPEAQQTDLASTLSLLLGTPPPFGSVGRPIRGLIELGARSTGATARQTERVYRHSLRVVAWQVIRYLETYVQAGGKLPGDRLRDLVDAFHSAGSDPDSADFVPVLERLLEDAGRLAREQWTQFSDAHMLAGLLLLALGVGVPAVGLAPLFAGDKMGDWKFAFAAVSTWSAVVLHGALFLSNSFILEEGPLLAGMVLICTLIVVRWASTSLQEPARAWPLWPAGESAAAWAPLLLLPAVRLQCAAGGVLDPSPWSLFANRRYDGSDPGIGLRELAAWVLRDDVRTLVGGVTGVGAAAAGTLGLLMTARTRATAATASRVAWACALGGGALAITYTAAGFVRVGGDEAASPSWLDWCARGVYACVIAGWASLCFQRVTGHGKRDADAPLLLALALLWPTMVVLHQGAGAQASLALWLASSAAIARWLQWARDAGGAQRARQAVAAVLPVVCHLGSLLFFATAHRCEFPALQYMSAYVGFPRFNFLRSAPLLGTNTFGHLLATAAALPALARATCGAGAGPEFRSTVVRLAIGVQLSRAVACLGAALAASLMKRHLMVWGLFAPKFVFEACFLVVTDVALLTTTPL